MRRCLWCVVLCLLIQLHVAEASGPASSDPAPTGAAETAAASAVLRGRVVDTSGGAVSGAQVTVVPLRAGVPASVATDDKGVFEIAAAPGAYVVRVSAEGFVETARRLTLVDGGAATADFTLEVAGDPRDRSRWMRLEAATPCRPCRRPPRRRRRCATCRRPSASSSSALIADQRMPSMADVVALHAGRRLSRRARATATRRSCAATARPPTSSSTASATTSSTSATSTTSSASKRSRARTR